MVWRERQEWMFLKINDAHGRDRESGTSCLLQQVITAVIRRCEQDLRGARFCLKHWSSGRKTIQAEIRDDLASMSIVRSNAWTGPLIVEKLFHDGCSMSRPSTSPVYYVPYISCSSIGSTSSSSSEFSLSEKDDGLKGSGVYAESGMALERRPNGLLDVDFLLGSRRRLGRSEAFRIVGLAFRISDMMIRSGQKSLLRMTWTVLT